MHSEEDDIDPYEWTVHEFNVQVKWPTLQQLMEIYTFIGPNFGLDSMMSRNSGVEGNASILK